MYQRAISNIETGVHKEEVSFRVAVVACLIIAFDYAQTYGVVPILPQYFEAIDLFAVLSTDPVITAINTTSSSQAHVQASQSISDLTTTLPIKNVTYSSNETSLTELQQQALINVSSAKQEAHSFAIGLVVSTKWAVQMAFCPLVGRLVDNHGVRWPVAFGLIMEMAFCFVFAIADSIQMFLFARAIQGLASAFVVTSMLSWLNLSYSGDTRKHITGWAFVTLDLGFALGPPITGTLYGLFGMGWTMFVSMIVFAILLVAFTITITAEKPRGETDDVSNVMDIILAAETPSKPNTTGIVSLLKDKRMMCLVVGFVVVDWAMTAWAPTLPVFMESELSITSPFIIGNIWLVTILPNLLAVRSFVYFNMTIPDHMFVVAVSAFLGIAVTCILTAYLTSSVWILALWMIIVTYFTSGMIYLLNITTIELIDRLTLKGTVSNYGSGIAIQEMALALGSTLAPTVSCSILLVTPKLHGRSQKLSSNETIDFRSIAGFKAMNIFIASLYVLSVLCMLPLRDLINAKTERSTSALSVNKKSDADQRTPLLEPQATADTITLT